MSIVAVILLALWLASGLTLRRRVGDLPVLEPAPDDGRPRNDRRVLSAPGVKVEAATLAAAGERMDRDGLEALDLIPGNVPALELLRTARAYRGGRAGERSYRRNPMAGGITSGYAVIVSEALLARAGLGGEPAVAPRRGRIYELAEEIKRFGGEAVDVAAAPGFRPAIGTIIPGAMAYRWLEAAPLVWFCIFMLALTVWAAVASPLIGGAALAVWHLQPAIALAGQRARAGGVAASCLLRIPLELWRYARTLHEALRPPDVALAAETRRCYDGLLADGTAALFDARAATCPACGSSRLRKQVETRDYNTAKQGVLRQDRCLECRHVFQNPRVNERGLAYYYGDHYVGVGKADWISAARFMESNNRRRARSVAGLLSPQRWLDVGTGFGHFCCVARQEWPGLAIDGLDFGDSVEEAQRCGWIDRAFREPFVELARSRPGEYDVVSLFHYLEHTADQPAEIRAAREVLAPGGALVIEAPDPDCPMGALLGRFWMQWVPTQHLNMAPVAGVERMLAAEGFEVHSVERREAHLGIEWFSTLHLLENWLGPATWLPWRRPATALDELRYGLRLAVTFPLFLPVIALELTHTAVLVGALGLSNSYRIVARRL